MKEDLVKEIEIPEKVSVTLGRKIKVTGPEGEVEKELTNPRIKIIQKDNKIILESKKATKQEKKVINSFQAHLRNMIKGVIEKYTYKLKICSGHFPMNVSLSNDQLIIKNFLGENTPRKLKITPNVDVKVEGNDITVTSVSKELAGQVAGSIEQLTRVRNRDIRIFQDGCYIINKAGKNLE